MNKILISILAFAAIFSSCGGSGTSKEDEEVIVIGQDKELKTSDQLSVVCLGNSITKHGYLPSVGWYGNWGMAASKEEYDYCHVLQSKLQKYNSGSSVTPINLGTYELDPTQSIDYLDTMLSGATIIVIRIGENVQDADVFSENFQNLIDKCKNAASNVLIVGSFWDNEDVETVLQTAARTNNLTYISLASVRNTDGVYPEKGDTLYDIDGNAYTIDSDFILTHPNDKGMSLIASKIFNGIASLYD